MSRIRALVTGASGAIGHAVARRLATQDMELILHYRSRETEARRLAEELGSGGSKAQLCAFDLADLPSVQQCIHTLLSEGPIQVLVNNACLLDDSRMTGMYGVLSQRITDI